MALLFALPSFSRGQDLFKSLLPEIEVVGKSNTNSRLEAPGRGEVLLIKPETLRASAQPSVAGLLRREAGVNFTSFLGSAATGTPQVRGFGENASSRILTLVDGLPMNRPDLASPVWFEFPLAGLEQVELQRGSRSVRYGSGALAGVISLETRSEITQPEWHLLASTGSWNTRLLRLHALQPVADGWTAGASLDFFESDGWRQNSATNSRAFQLSLASPSTQPLQWQFTVGGSRTGLENPGGLTTAAYLDDPRQSVYTRFGVGRQYRNQLSTLRATQRIRYQDPESGHLWQLQTSWTGRERVLNFGTGSHTDHDLETFAFDFSHEWDHQSWAGSWGLRGSSDFLDVDRFQEPERVNRFAAARFDRASIGGFAQAARQFQKGWTVAGGISWDAYRLEADSRDSSNAGNPLANFSGDTDDASWGGEISLDYQPDDSRRFWLRFDRSFRFPLLDEIAGYQGFLLDTPVNVDLRPETGAGMELGASYEGDRINASLSAFVQDLHGEILFDFNENLNTNFAGTRRLGLESRLVWQSNRWSARLNHQWIATRFTDGPFKDNRIPLVPEHQVNVHLSGRLHDQLQLSLEWEWLDQAFEGGDFTNNRPPLPGRSLVHLESRLHLNDHWELFGRVDNLFDETWASLKYLGLWYPGNGRSITLGLRGQF